mmetsp:Transcript_11543/g.46716  ORF Transcript_11543/g.46716 Transcript_11543/m.46716 type:complete len:202 (+) Transcript_11543:407-1012(+)
MSTPATQWAASASCSTRRRRRACFWPSRGPRIWATRLWRSIATAPGRVSPLLMMIPRTTARRRSSRRRRRRGRSRSTSTSTTRTTSSSRSRTRRGSSAEAARASSTRPLRRPRRRADDTTAAARSPSSRCPRPSSPSRWRPKCLWARPAHSAPSPSAGRPSGQGPSSRWRVCCRCRQLLASKELQEPSTTGGSSRCRRLLH